MSGEGLARGLEADRFTPERGPPLHVLDLVCRSYLPSLPLKLRIFSQDI